MSARLFVGNLSFDTNELELRDLFGQYGELVEVKVVSDGETGRPRGFAFVEMSDADQANKAISELDGRELGGRTIKVNPAESRPPRAQKSGGGGRW